MLKHIGYLIDGPGEPTVFSKAPLLPGDLKAGFYQRKCYVRVANKDKE